MGAFRKFGSILLLAVLFGYPAMACLTPGVEMTAAEHDCCKRMAQRCGSMNMPNSHSCCQKDVRQPNSMFRTTRAQFVPPTTSEAQSISVLPKLAESEISLYQLHPPPESPPSTASILRI